MPADRSKSGTSGAVATVIGFPDRLRRSRTFTHAAKLRDRLAAAHDDQGIVGGEFLTGIGVEDHFASRSSHGHDEHLMAMTWVGAADCLAGQRACFGQRHFFQIDIEHLAVGHLVDYFGRVWPCDHTGDASRPDHSRQDDAIGPRLDEFPLGRLLFAAGDDPHVAIECPRGECQEDVIGVAIECGDQGFGFGKIWIYFF